MFVVVDSCRRPDVCVASTRGIGFRNTVAWYTMYSYWRMFVVRDDDDHDDETENDSSLWLFSLGVVDVCLCCGDDRALFVSSATQSAAQAIFCVFIRCSSVCTLYKALTLQRRHKRSRVTDMASWSRKTNRKGFLSGVTKTKTK